MSKRMTVNARAYQKVFNSEEGKIILKDLMKRCYLKDTTYDGDQNAMMFREGTRSVVLHIFTQLKTDISILEKLMRERDNVEETI